MPSRTRNKERLGEERRGGGGSEGKKMVAKAKISSLGVEDKETQDGGGRR